MRHGKKTPHTGGTCFIADAISGSRQPRAVGIYPTLQSHRPAPLRTTRTRLHIPIRRVARDVFAGAQQVGYESLLLIYLRLP